MKLVSGVGINDAEYQVTTYAVIGGQQKQMRVCPFYRAWRNLLIRCYSAKEHQRHPTYAGCTVAAEWLTFSVFREWMISQDWEGNQLDKDILWPGNKIYSPQSCVFISRALNTFMTDHGAARGQWPIGVHWNKSNGKFLAKCSNPFIGKEEHLGYFDCPNSAHEAWRKRKHQHACTYASQQTDKRISDALRARYSASEEMQ